MTNELFKIEDFCETSNWSNDENSKHQSPERSCRERSSDQESERDRKAYVERKVGECFQWKSNGQCSNGDSCSFQLWTSLGKPWLRWETKRTIVLSRTKFEAQDWQRGKNPQQNQAAELKALQTKGAEFRAEKEIVIIRRVKIRHPPVCQNYKSKTRCRTWQQRPFSTCWGGGEAQQEVEERWCERISLLYWRSLHIWVGCLKILIRGNLFNVNKENWDQNTPSTSPRARGPQIKIRGRVHREELPQSVRLMSARQKLEARSHEETWHQERCARGAWNLANNIYKLKNADKATRYTSVEARAMPAPTSKRPEERKFVVDSGASMRMLSKKDLSSDELDTLRRSRNPITVVTVQGEVQTNEEVQVCDYDPDLVVLVQLLEETPAVYRLENSAKTTDIPMSGSTVKNHGWPKRRRQLHSKRTISYRFKVFERSFACFSKVIPSATMPLLGVPEFTSFLPVFASSATTPTPLTGIRLTRARLRSGVDRLAIWPIRLQTQVMSPSSASTSVAGDRRSAFRLERAASSWRVTH